MTTTTDAAARLRSEVERVKGKHEPSPFRHDITGSEYCSCGDFYPCDTARLAGVVETLVTALETAEVDFDVERIMANSESSEHDGMRSYRMNRGRKDARAALAAAARELEGGSE